MDLHENRGRIMRHTGGIGIGDPLPMRVSVDGTLPREAGASVSVARTSVRLLPIVFFEVYLGATVALFALGPWRYAPADPFKLYAFLGAAQLALLLGYLSACFGRGHGYTGHWRADKLLFASVVVNLVLLPLTYVNRTGVLIPNLLEAFANPGLAYNVYMEGQRQVQWIEYVRFLLGPITLLQVPLTVFYWPKLTRALRWASVASISGGALLYAAIGTNKGIADLVLLVPCLLVASVLARVNPLRKRQLLVLGAVCVVGFAVFFTFFARGQAARVGSFSASGYMRGVGFVDRDNILVRSAPSGMQTGVVGMTSYVTQGYYALSMALDLPFEPMWGTGSSMWVTRQVSRFDPGWATRSYPARLQQRGLWDAEGLWSSIYPWLASDVSFPGVLLIVFLVGRLLASAWLDTLRAANPFAVACLAYLLIMLFYFSANNQVMQSPESLFGFFATLILWQLTRRRFVWT